MYRIARDCVEVPLHLYHFCKKDIENYCSANQLVIEQCRSFSYPGMYRFAGTLLPQLRSLSAMTLLEAYYLQRAFDRLDEVDLGNDMVVVIRRQGAGFTARPATQ